MTPVTIRNGISADIQTLTDICFRSKAHWGYPQGYIDLWSDELTITAGMIETCQCFVAVDPAEQITGFCILSAKPPAMEIEALYVDPDFIGSGIGRLLINLALNHARTENCTSIELDSDPNALAFYQRMGGAHIGDTPSTVIAGRTLPRVRIAVPPDANGPST